MDDQRFNVCQFFEDETYEYVRRGVSAEEAVETAHHYCTSLGAKMGTTRRVIITDEDDFTNFEWKFGEGVTYPPQEERMADKNDPFAEGADAALAGKSETDNPYDPNADMDSYTKWNDGWASIHEEDEERTD